MSGVKLSSCDTHSSNSRDRLCWHLDQRYGGYRCGDTKSLNSSTQWKKLVLIGDGLRGEGSPERCDNRCSAGTYVTRACTQAAPVVCSRCRACSAGQ